MLSTADARESTTTISVTDTTRSQRLERSTDETTRCVHAITVAVATADMRDSLGALYEGLARNRRDDGRKRSEDPNDLIHASHAALQQLKPGTAACSERVQHILNTGKKWYAETHAEDYPESAVVAVPVGLPRRADDEEDDLDQRKDQGAEAHRAEALRKRELESCG
jgi:hypothetical protein